MRFPVSSERNEGKEKDGGLVASNKKMVVFNSGYNSFKIIRLQEWRAQEICSESHATLNINENTSC